MPPAARDVDAGEVALGGVDEVTDDVAHLPVAGRGRRLPRRGRRCQRQHLVGLLPDRSQQVVLAGEVAELPLTHEVPLHGSCRFGAYARGNGRARATPASGDAGAELEDGAGAVGRGGQAAVRRVLAGDDGRPTERLRPWRAWHRRRRPRSTPTSGRVRPRGASRTASMIPAFSPSATGRTV